MHRVAHVIFSTNRIEYLTHTLLAQSQQLDWHNCSVERIFIDDYPLGRDDQAIVNLVKSYGFDRIQLHTQNCGLSQTWTDFWNWIRTEPFDWIWHQEDDVRIEEPIRIQDLIELMCTVPQLSQVQLSRQAWYPGETDPQPSDTDLQFKNWRYDTNRFIFSPMASLYPHWITTCDWSNYLNHTLNEVAIGTVLKDHWNLTPCNLRSAKGTHLVTHLGEWFVGRRVLPGEPGWEQFKWFDPQRRYASRTGEPWD